MIRWQQLRSFSLVITFCGVISVLGKSILDPDPLVKPTAIPAPFVFPAEVPLTGWQPLASRPLVNKFAKNQKLLSGRLYQYKQNKIPIDIETLYTVETSGNVMGFIRNYTSIPLSAIQISSRSDRYQEAVGYYLLFVYQKRAYLTSCINPHGESTITLPQFQHNRYTYDIQFSRLLNWLINQENIRDLRCVWVHSSIPLNTNSPKDAYTILENAWFSWYQWWYPRFPKL